jgi:hypothetical protein
MSNPLIEISAVGAVVTVLLGFVQVITLVSTFNSRSAWVAGAAMTSVISGVLWLLTSDAGK